MTPLWRAGPLLFLLAAPLHGICVEPPPLRVRQVQGCVADDAAAPQPLSGARIELYDRSAWGRAARRHGHGLELALDAGESGLAPVATGNADRVGCFTLEHVRRGRYRLRVSLEGFPAYDRELRVSRWQRGKRWIFVRLGPPVVAPCSGDSAIVTGEHCPLARAPGTRR